MDYTLRYSHDEVQSYLRSHFQLNENLIDRLSSNHFVMKTSALVVASARAGMGTIVVFLYCLNLNFFCIYFSSFVEKKFLEHIDYCIYYIFFRT